VKDNNLNKKIITAAKWSSFTEIAAKLVIPITNMILARILVPEAFGVVATVTMVTSFVQMFTDSGFQKYLVQHEFESSKEKYESANVAFWSNFGIAIILWLMIIIFDEQLATLVGNPGLGHVISIACIQLPITAFSSIQMALYRRNFDFKTLFIVRIISVFIPFVVTIPLALTGLSYWALIIGNLTMQLSNAVILTLKSKWKPSSFYSIEIFKRMFSFSVWSLIEAISIWLASWIDTFIIGSVLDQYYLGLYRTSITMVNSIMALIKASVIPILFSTLSRLQNNEQQFNYMYFKFQRLISIVVFPLGVGVYLYSDLAIEIMLGNQWSEASSVIGHWALTSAIMTVFGNLCSEVYRAKGKPKLSFLAQVLHLIVLVPACIISARYGFWALVYTRSWIRLQFVFVHFIVMKYAIGISIVKTLKNVSQTTISTLLMGSLGYFLQQINTGILWDLVSIVICIVFYFGVLLLFPKMRKELVALARSVLPARIVERHNQSEPPFRS
jgi:PST family polysaccharide transporter